MRIISFAAIRNYAKKHADADVPLRDWYKKTDFNDVEKSFKLISSKGRKFINNFNKFFSIEKRNFEYIPISLYEDYNLSL